ncbi:MAG TPA: cytidylate kinase-like family protein [Mycobacterium sp.]
MGNQPVVTIFEQYGSGADAVGRQVADALGVPYHAQAFSSQELEGAEANLKSNAVLVTVYSVMGGAYGGLEGLDVVATQREKYDLVMENNRSLQQEAEGGGVLVGRNATVVLAGRPNTVHVLLTGSREDRVARAAQDAGIPIDRAQKRQQREDEVRAEMSKALYGWDPRLPDRYDLVINTSRIPVDAAASAIVSALRVIVG